MDLIKTDICVIGGGAAGLSVASSAALLGVPVVLIEKAEMGGDCLNRGCVPSKALIAAANAAATGRAAHDFGIAFGTPRIDGAAVMRHVRSVIEAIAPIDSVERYAALGVRVINGTARFIDGKTVAVGDVRISARRFVIATGGAPIVPNITGIGDLPYLTSDSIFAQETLPTRLAIVGGGAIGIELAQAFQRLGTEVTVIEGASILSREEPEAAALLRAQLRQEGVALLEGAQIVRVQPLTSGLTLDLTTAGVPSMLNHGQLLIATGRAANLEGLGLAEAGVRFAKAGIEVDSRLRTSNRRIFAIGDCINGPKFTHTAAYQANIVIRNAVFRQSAKADYSFMPRVTYCDPEIASVGLSEIEARAQHRSVQTLRWPFSENDRARATRRTDGFVKAMIDRKGRILGATIVGPDAGELIAPWVLAMQQRLSIDALAGMIAPYPTRTEASRRAAIQALVPRLRNPWLARLIRLVRALG